MTGPSINNEFRRAVAFVDSRSGSDIRLNDEQKLEIYALFKQGKPRIPNMDKEKKEEQEGRQQLSFLEFLGQ